MIQIFDIPKRVNKNRGRHWVDNLIRDWRFSRKPYNHSRYWPIELSNLSRVN